MGIDPFQGVAGASTQNLAKPCPRNRTNESAPLGLYGPQGFRNLPWDDDLRPSMRRKDVIRHPKKGGGPRCNISGHRRRLSRAAVAGDRGPHRGDCRTLAQRTATAVYPCDEV